MRRSSALRALAAAIGGPQAGAALLAVGALLAVLLPLPGFAVDLLLALSLGAAVGVLLVALASPEPGRLTSLPPVLVLTSLARIMLCLCVSRLVLVTGEGGSLVLTLGRTFSGGDAIAGVGLLVVLAVVHLAMVTAGVGRMSEVAARFALDAMPGKQMGLDTALGRGQVTADEAREQVQRLEQEASFYGAMDGAARLLRGEAVATVVIVALTAVAGAARAMAAATDGLAEAATLYALMATGQGLVIILPALLMGAAAAVVVSRSASGSGLVEEAHEQMTGSLWPLAAAAGALLVLGLVPGVAKAPTLVAGAGLGALAWWLSARRAGGGAWSGDAAGEGATVPADELVAEAGLGLLDLADAPGGLLEALGEVREEMSAALGFELPPVIVRDSISLRATEYAISFREQPLARGIVRPQRLLVVPPTAGVTPDLGRPGEVGDGRTGTWVTAEEAETLGSMEYLVLGPVEVIAEHVRFALRRHAADLFDLAAASRMLRHVDAGHPEAVAEARTAGVTASLLRQVGGRVLEGGLPLRDPLSVIEAIAEALPATSDPEALALRCVPHLTGIICGHLAPDGKLRALGLSPELEDELEDAAHRSEDRTVAALSSERATAWTRALDEVAREHGWGRPLAVVCEQRALLALLDLHRQVPSELIPLSAADLPASVTVEFVARLDPDHVH